MEDKNRRERRGRGGFDCSGRVAAGDKPALAAISAAVYGRGMSTVAEIEEAAANLPAYELQELIEDLLDLAEARGILAEIEAGQEETVSLDDLEKRLGQ